MIEFFQKYLQDFKRRFAYNSAGLEGNTTEWDAVLYILNDNKEFGYWPEDSPIPSINEIIEIRNFDYAINDFWVDIFSKKNIDIEFIKKTHISLCKETGISEKYLATFKPLRNYCIDGSTSVKHYYCDPIFVNQKLLKLNEDFEKWINNSNSIEDKIKSILKYHVCFEQVHPFVDGNGRVGRYLLSYQFLNCGILPPVFKKEDRQKYLSFLREARKDAKDANDTDNVFVSKNFVDWVKDAIAFEEEKFIWISVDCKYENIFAPKRNDYKFLSLINEDFLKQKIKEKLLEEEKLNKKKQKKHLLK